MLTDVSIILLYGENDGECLILCFDQVLEAQDQTLICRSLESYVPGINKLLTKLVVQ